MKKLLLTIASLFFLFSFSLTAQTTLQINGVVADSSGEALSHASILILDAQDSTYIGFTQSDNSGNFNIKEKTDKPIILKISYLGYFSFEKRIDPIQTAKLELGTIRLTPINKVLFEVVIKEAKAPLKMRGDTIEYDASTFKVPIGSTVEDLLRKLPGIEVANDGSITSQGQAVNKLTVDGKRFFGEDPSMATKNLPAESVSKVQVFNEKSEQEKLTGLSIEKDQKTMNLELKDEFKKGGFGKILAGLGIEQRDDFQTGTSQTEAKWEMKGNYNKFNKKEQFSLIGVQNNTGRNGMNWNDYQDFRGQQSWEWNFAEELFSFSQSFRYYVGGTDESSDEFGGSEGYFGDDAAGIPKNSQAGFNYNYDYNKTKISGSYTYKQNNLFAKAIRKRQFFLPDQNYTTDDQSDLDRKNGSHRAELIFEKELDSLHTILFKLRGNGIFTNQISHGKFLNLSEEGNLTSSLNLDRNADRKNLGWQGVAYFKKKFENKRRNLGVNFIYSENDRETDEDLYSNNNYYGSGGMDSIVNLDQFIDFNTNIRSIKSSALYVEPLGKNFALQFLGNYIQRNDQLVRDVFDKLTDTLVANQDYTYDNDHLFRMGRVGTSLQFGKAGFNVSGGLAVQSIYLNGQFQQGIQNFSKINKDYLDVLQTVSLNYQLATNKRMSLNYSSNVQEPSFKNLSPIIDNTNPFFIRIGNPELDPEVLHQFSGNYNGNNQIKFTNYNINLNYTYYENQHINEQTIDSFLVSTSRAVNFKGGQRMGTFLFYSFPIIKNRFTVRTSLNYSFNLSKSIINSVLNDSKGNYTGFGVNLSWTPNEIYSIYSENRWNYSKTSYSIQSDQNYTIFSQTYNLQGNARLLWDVFCNASLDYRLYNNDQFNVAYNIPILNASVYKLFLKNKGLELRLSAYDLLNKNISIQQQASGTQISDTRTYTLARYFMLSLSYNMKGIKASVKRSNEWMY